MMVKLIHGERETAIQKDRQREGCKIMTYDRNEERKRKEKGKRQQRQDYELEYEEIEEEKQNKKIERKETW